MQTLSAAGLHPGDVSLHIASDTHLTCTRRAEPCGRLVCALTPAGPCGPAGSSRRGLPPPLLPGSRANAEFDLACRAAGALVRSPPLRRFPQALACDDRAVPRRLPLFRFSLPQVQQVALSLGRKVRLRSTLVDPRHHYQS